KMCRAASRRRRGCTEVTWCSASRGSHARTSNEPPGAGGASMTAPVRVAILGGGCASIAAAYDLTRPELGGRYRVTVYQQGWRLGGKGASGRGPAGRIEEHGLHLWMGWYENAFRLLRE